MRRYTKEHAWVLPKDGSTIAGLTKFAQEQLGDIVYVDLPKPGTLIEAGRTMGTVESVKTESELVAPVSGQVTEVNPLLADQPERLNQDPEGEAWMIKVKLSAPAELDSMLDAAGYAAFLKTTG